DRGGTDPRWSGTGRRRRALRADGLRRVRTAAQRVLHGLPDAVRLRGSEGGDRPPHLALAAEPVGGQGCWRGRRHPRARGDRLRDRGCRGLPHRPDADLAVGAVGAPPAARSRRDPVPAAGSRRLELERWFRPKRERWFRPKRGRWFNGGARMKLTGEATL